MKRKDFQKFLFAAAGLVVLAMRNILYATAVDATGRVAAGHPLRWAVTGVSLLAAVGIVLSWKEEALPKQGLNAGLGHLALALGIGTTVAANAPLMPGTLGLAWLVSGWLSVPCLAVAGFFRLKKQPVPFLTHAIPTVFLLVHLLNHYQLWCRNPQLMDILFPLLAVIALTVTLYQHTAFDVGMGSGRQLNAAQCAALFLCMAELNAGSSLYLAGAIFAATGLYRDWEV